MFATAAHECPACGYRWTANAKEERQITAEWRQRQMNKAQRLIVQGVSTAEAARRLNVPVRALYQWLNRDERPVHRLKVAR